MRAARLLVTAMLTAPLAVLGYGLQSLREPGDVTTVASTGGQQVTATAAPAAVAAHAATGERRATAAATPPVRTATAAATSTTGSASTTSATRKTSTGAKPASAQRAAVVGVRAGEQTLRDLAYATSSQAQQLDLYLPERTGAAVPLVIYIHGGAFSGGDKGEGGAEMARELVPRGYAVASVNYRLSGEARFPAGAQDVKASVRWLRAHAATYGLHPAQFTAWGESAGGYLAALIGASGDRTTVLDDASLGSAGTSGAVQAVVDLFGPSDFTTMDEQANNPGGCRGEAQSHGVADSPESQWLGRAVADAGAAARAASPVAFVAGARSLPPFVVMHGDADCSVPHGQSAELASALRAKGASVTYRLISGAGHDDPAIVAAHPEAIAVLDALFRR